MCAVGKDSVVTYEHLAHNIAVNKRSLASGFSMKRSASLLLGLGESVPSRANEKLKKKSSVDDVLESTSEVVIAIEPYPQVQIIGQQLVER